MNNYLKNPTLDIIAGSYIEIFYIHTLYTLTSFEDWIVVLC